MMISDRELKSYSSYTQMKISLGKILVFHYKNKKENIACKEYG